MQKINSLNSAALKFGISLFLCAFYSGQAFADQDCTLTPTQPNADFSISNLLDLATNDASLTKNVTFNVACWKTNIAANGKFCMKLGQGSAGLPTGTLYQNRWLAFGSEYMGVQIYRGANSTTNWGPDNSGTYSQISHDLSGMSVLAGRYDIPNSKLPADKTFTVKLLDTFPTVGGISSIKMLAPGPYQTTFNDTNTNWRLAFGLGIGSDCSSGTIANSGVKNFSFTVTANIAAQCKIKGTLADIDFGTQSGTATNLQGSTALTVQCTRTTPYYIGLLPGNGNTAGAGLMYGQAPLTAADTVAYQLRSTAGMSGTIWGNTATSISVGNGVAGTGTGSDQNHTIYATLASANAAAGNYQDTVTVTVNY